MSGAARNTNALCLPVSLRHKLQCAGLRTTHHLQGLSSAQLADELGISQDEAQTILEAAVTSPNLSLLGAKPATEVLTSEQQTRHITTLCQELDEILGGGIAPGQLTEICGVPGAGKTQLGIQLSVSVQIPVLLRGLAGAALFIDCEGNFVVERVAAMAGSAVHWARAQSEAKQGPGLQAAVSYCMCTAVASFTKEAIADSIRCHRVTDQAELVAAIEGLPSFLELHPEVRLVVIDSIAFHFRQGTQGMADRSRLLAGLSQQLVQQAEARDVAVVVMNHVTIKPAVDGQTQIIPSLGDGWAHAVTSRVLLKFEQSQRTALVLKSPCFPNRAALFEVTNEGIRDVSARNKRPRIS